MSFINFFSGFAHPAIAASFVAALVMTSGCGSIGAYAGAKATGASDRQAVGAAVGAALGDLFARDLGHQTRPNSQAPQGQVVVVVQPPEINMAAQCQAAGRLVIRVGDGTYKCVIPIVLTPTVKPCTRTVQGWENDRYAGLSRGLRSASDKQVPC